MSSSLRDIAEELRVEDVLTVLLVCALLVVRASLGSVAGAEQRFEYSFVAFPAALIIFGASVRYALGRAGGAAETLRRIGRVIRDWLPFALFLSFYETLGSVIFSAPARERDAALLHIDRVLFGETPSVPMQRWIEPGLTDFLGFCYFLHLILPPLAAFLWYRRDLATFRMLLLSVFLCGAIGGIGYVLVPAVGPARAYPQLYSRPLHGTAGIQVVTMMENVRAPHDVFPSLHIAISAVVLWFAWRYGPRLFWPILPFVLGNWVSTLYLRLHYAIDVVVGFPFAAAMIALAAALLRLEQRWREKMTARAAGFDGDSLQ